MFNSIEGKKQKEVDPGVIFDHAGKNEERACKQVEQEKEGIVSHGKQHLDGECAGQGGTDRDGLPGGEPERFAGYVKAVLDERGERRVSPAMAELRAIQPASPL